MVYGYVLSNSNKWLLILIRMIVSRMKTHLKSAAKSAFCGNGINIASLH